MEVIRWGKQQNKQRFKCKNCGLFFTRLGSESKSKNRFIWFKKWVLERQIYRTLVRDSGLSRPTLQRLFYGYLNKAPLIPIKKNLSVYLQIDATYFKQFCLICYQDYGLRYTQLFRFTKSESYEEIREDLENLKKLGLCSA